MVASMRYAGGSGRTRLMLDSILPGLCDCSSEARHSSPRLRRLLVARWRGLYREIIHGKILDLARVFFLRRLRPRIMIIFNAGPLRLMYRKLRFASVEMAILKIQHTLLTRKQASKEGECQRLGYGQAQTHRPTGPIAPARPMSG